MSEPVLKPTLSVDEVKQRCHQLYSIQVVSAKELIAYDDQNFLVSTSQGEEYIFKVSNGGDSNVDNLLEDLNRLMTYCRSKGCPVPQPVASIDGPDVVRLPVNGSSFAHRLFKFLPGTLLKDIPFEPDILFKVGVQLAKLDDTLKGFHSEVIMKRDIMWSLKSLPQLKDYLHSIKDPTRRDLVQNVMDTFKLHVLDQYDQFEESIIHGDFNEANILVDKVDGSYEVTGIIDFGDTNYSLTMFDLSCLICYMMLTTKEIPMMEVAVYVIRGYHSICPLDKKVVPLIPLCVAARLAQSLTLGAFAHMTQPSNEYVLTTAKNGWDILAHLFPQWKEVDWFSDI